jgi:hypothetical protein
VRLVYALLFDGQEVGDVVLELQRDSIAGYEVIRTRQRGSALNGLFDLDEELVFGARDFVGVRYRRDMKLPSGERAHLSLRNDSGRVHGTRGDVDGGMTAVDAALPRGTLLPGMSRIVVWLNDPMRRAELHLPTFSVETTSIDTVSLRVLGEDTITVPAGRFAVWRLELDDGEEVTRMFVRKTSPHYVVREVPAGDLEFQLRIIQ